MPNKKSDHRPDIRTINNMLAEGKTVKEIADFYGCTTANIYAKIKSVEKKLNPKADLTPIKDVMYDEENKMVVATKDGRSKQIIAAIGDGISALSQIHAASNGAVVNQGTGSTLAEGVAKRHERLRRERDTNENRLLGYLRERRNSEIAAKKAKNDEARNKLLAESNEYKAKYHAALEENFKNKAELEKQKQAEREREFNEKQAAAKEKADKDRQSRERTADKNRAAANARAAKAEAGRNARHAKSEANKDKRAANSGNKNKPAGGNTGGKKHKQNPYG